MDKQDGQDLITEGGHSFFALSDLCERQDTEGTKVFIVIMIDRNGRY